MSTLFSRINRLPPYVFNVIGELKHQARAKGLDVIDFSMGNPDAETPAHIVEKLVETARKPDTHRYSASKGIPRLRSAITDWYRENYQVDLDPEAEAIVTIGSKEGIAHLAMAILGPGDSVLVPNPTYPIHPYGVIIAGADVRHVPLSEHEDFAEALKEAIAQSWPKPKLLILNFPANPTGQCVDLAFFESIVAIAKAHNIWILHDFAYAELCFDGYRAPSILQVPGAKDIAVEFYSLSKSYNMAGWRVGFCCGNKELVGALTRLKSYLDYGIFTPIQVAAIQALKGSQDCVEQNRQMYQRRRDILCEGLTRLQWPVQPPKATMFVWAKIPPIFQGMGSVEFSKLLVEEAQVAVSPGLGFGQLGDQYVRFALIENEQRTRQALKNLKRLFENCQRETMSDTMPAVQYRSTRGGATRFSFQDVVMSGLARDGGLYIPDVIPQVGERLARWKELSYQQLAVEVMLPFVGSSLTKQELKNLVDKSYESFSHESVTPLIHGENDSLLELFHGPTHAFKDVALQFLGNLFEHFLNQNNQDLTIVGATSGDTGSAAINGVRNKKGLSIFMLYPKGKISAVQEKQMTTVIDDNVVNMAIDGTFDDCQALVKALFSDLEFRDSVNLGAVNSINWARILAQVVYYFYAAFRFQERYPDEPLVYSVPTGNFGDVYAGHIARRMGLPIEKLIIGTNENNILERVYHSGVYQVDTVQATVSPAMDIQVASNFERLLFELCDEDGSAVQEKMTALKSVGRYQLSEEQQKKIRHLFAIYSVDKAMTYKTMAKLAEEGIVCDPHTAVGLSAASQYRDENQKAIRCICLATAHPAKFPDIVEAAVGVEPEQTENIKKLAGKPSRFQEAPVDIATIAKLIRTHHEKKQAS